MAGHGFSILLAPLWQEWDEPIFRMVEGIHRRLPRSIPPVTLHGRQLDPTDEGFGAQYQLTMNGALSGGRHAAAYYVIQIRPLRQAPPPARRGPDAVARLIWRVDTLKVLQPVRPDAQIEQFDQQSFEAPVARPAELAELFGETLFEAARSFFREMLAGIRLAD
jgi:hypothetical protein